LGKKRSPILSIRSKNGERRGQKKKTAPSKNAAVIWCKGASISRKRKKKKNPISSHLGRREKRRETRPTEKIVSKAGKKEGTG